MKQTCGNCKHSEFKRAFPLGVCKQFESLLLSHGRTSSPCMYIEYQRVVRGDNASRCEKWESKR